ncbi:HAD-like domain-containing protein [Gorgonomyces haynaldii]|nr:HAD-like domain-containing protein [Gorgonomyces haynaldii]
MQPSIADFDTFLLDCDGVVWHGNHLIPGVKQVIEQLKGLGKQVLFVTNNASKSRKDYIAKFAKLGITITEDDVFGSAYASAYYMANTLNLKGEKVYVVGMKGLTHELESCGIQWAGSYLDNENITDMTDVEGIVPDPAIKAVVLGFDLDINYKKIAKAFTYVNSQNCHFIATNADSTYPTNDRIFPGTGALLSTLITSLGRQPKVIGKPHQTMLDVIVDKYHLNRSRTIMVGDRLDTDILFGQQGSMKTLLVMTGVTTKEALEKTDIRPDFVLPSFGDLQVS